MTRRRALLGCLVLALVLATVTAPAQRRTTYEQITVSNTAVGLSSTTYANMEACEGRVETAQIRWRVDASPTASVGTILDPGDVLRLPRIEDAGVVKFIRTGSTDATFDVWCWSR